MTSTLEKNFEKSRLIQISSISSSRLNLACKENAEDYKWILKIFNENSPDKERTKLHAIDTSRTLKNSSVLIMCDFVGTDGTNIVLKVFTVNHSQELRLVSKLLIAPL